MSRPCARAAYKYAPAQRQGISRSIDFIPDTNQPKPTTKMKSFIVLALFVAAAVAAPAGDDAVAQILKQEVDNIGVDGYSYGYETSNGISAQEQGQLKNAGSENEAIEVRGQFSYTGADGVVYTVTYVANENGFQPQGAHLPVAP
ncbi:flexible cuticle protein 12-like [Ostrinia furnacalis]|uniref:flexible cuticle protein 12-like n=1 Tax=Ostrinia furnacalis TaxID=93504 RepID=UPI0010402F45|nr:flexible cuticle protein 12-like [Ostrinia furnacalis]